MKAKRAEFTVSASKPNGFPAPALPEFAFAGRSNVGKSSLLNALAGHTALARTSNTPGRTRLINWFEILPPKGKPISFVDLPGYGYAKVSKSMRNAWRPLIESYLTGRDVLRAVVLLIDARRSPGDEERDFLAWLEEEDVPVIVVMTKADKLSKSKRKPAAMVLKKELGLSRVPLAFSALSGDGIDDLWRAILNLHKG